jgi:hypothetical protein
MSGKIKNIVIPAMLIAITLPFIVLTDLFPFLRFGMFAEPIKPQTYIESFEISYIKPNQKEIIVQPESLGIEKHFFPYIARNHFYRNEAKSFLQKISTIKNDATISEWRLKKFQYQIDNPNKVDTIIIHYRKNG